MRSDPLILPNSPILESNQSEIIDHVIEAKKFRKLLYQFRKLKNNKKTTAKIYGLNGIKRTSSESGNYNALEMIIHGRQFLCLKSL